MARRRGPRREQSRHERSPSSGSRAELETFRVEHPNNEASGLLGIQSPLVLRKMGWDVAFWIVSDELEAGRAVAALGRRQRGGKWDVVRLGRRGGKDAKTTDDAETLARAGSWVYVLGSQFGSKDGPLELQRHFIARFNEALVAQRGKRLSAELEVARRPFLLHRLVNDALREAGVDVFAREPAVQEEFVKPVLERGVKKRKRWSKLLRPDDTPVNVEGATFLPGGNLLLGLRFPVTADGHPLLVELEGIDRYFDAPRVPPEIVAVRVVTPIGSRSAPAGVRELDYLGGEIHLITGNLDSKPEESALLAHHPRAANAPNEHWVVPLAQGAGAATELPARRVRSFAEGASVEGLALHGDDVWYAHDDDVIRLSVARAPEGTAARSGETSRKRGASSPVDGGPARPGKRRRG